MSDSRLAVIFSLAAAFLSHPVSAQTPPPSVGLLVVAHGADSGWNARVHQVVEQVRWNGPVEVSFLMGAEAASASWQAGVDRLIERGASEIVAVPLMVSSNGAHVRQIRYYAGELDSLPAALRGSGHDHHHPAGRPGVPVRVTRALDASPELGEVLASRWNELSDLHRSRPLVLVAHGPGAIEDVPAWVVGLESATASLARELPDGKVHVGLLRDDAAAEIRADAIAGLRDTIATLAAAAGDSVTVMTVLVSSGSIDRVKIPNDLVDMPMRYVGAVLSPHPALARWIGRIARTELANASNSTSLENSR